MVKKILTLVLFLSMSKIFAQIDNDSIDTKYLEDQIYLSLSYNILINKPLEISQNGFSGGIAIGFIKDLPINNKRNIGFGLGVGYSYDVFIQNLKIFEQNGSSQVSIVENYAVNRFRMHAIEVPIEFRWRNSTPTKYKFWRIYSGIKLKQVFLVNSTFKDDLETIQTKNISEFNKFKTGIYIATGYSTWNLYVYYGLNPIFKDLSLDGKRISMNEINVGLKFYIM